MICAGCGAVSGRGPPGHVHSGHTNEQARLSHGRGQVCKYLTMGISVVEPVRF